MTAVEVVKINNKRICRLSFIMTERTIIIKTGEEKINLLGINSFVERDGSYLLSTLR